MVMERGDIQYEIKKDENNHIITQVFSTSGHLTARTITTHNNTINAEIPERFQE